MDEKNVYSPQGEVAPVQQTPSQAPVVSVAPTQPPPAPPPPPPPPSTGFPFGLIIKIIIGLGVLSLLFFIVTRFVLPMVGPKQPEKPVTLTYWGLWEDKNIMSGVISEFEKQHPNITVDYQRQDIKQYKDRLVTRTAAGTGPDIFRFHNSWVPMLSGELLPLSEDVIKPAEFKNIYYPVIQQDLIHNGAIYGIPLQIDTLALFVNKEILDAQGIDVPTTWDDFVKAAKLFVVKDDDKTIKTAGAALGTYDNITHAPDIISLLMVQNGADLKNLEKTQQQASEALAFYSSFANGDDSVWDGRLDPSLLLFAQGNLAMYFGYSWDIFSIKALNENLPFSIHPVPILPGRKLTIASYWVEGISSKTAHPKESLLFMQFLAQKETQQKLYTEQSKVRLFGELYARKDLANTLKDNALIFPFIEQAPNAVSTFFVSDTHDDSSGNPGINARMNQYLKNAINGTGGNTSAETAIDTLSKGVSQVLKQYGQ